jgi:hemoglobin/transferrin/lactoferrin receptor protein
MSMKGPDPTPRHEPAPGPSTPLVNRNRLNWLASAIGLVLAAAAHGTTAPPTVGSPGEAQGEATELEMVTVSARRLVPVSRVAATVTVITEADLQRGLAADVKQMVRYEPGLSVRSDPFRFGLDTFTVRGMTGNRVAVEVDGIPSAGGFSVGSYSDSGRSFADVAFVQRVEVLRGPASSLYGSDAIGGVVAMTTLAPGTLLAEGAGLRTEVGYGSDDDGWHAAAIGAGQAGSVDYLLGYVHREGHEADTAADVTPDPRDYDSDSVLAKARFDAVPGGPLTLTAEGGWLSQRTDVDAFERLAGSRFVNTVELRGDDSGERFRVSVDQRLGAVRGFDTADWRFYWQGTDTRQDTYEERVAVPPRTPAVQIDRSFRLEDRTLGAEFTAAKDLAYGTTRHDVVYGFEASGTRLEERRDGSQTNLATGVTTPTILGETFPLRDFPISDVTEIGVFVQDEMRFGESPWSVIPALRADYYRLSPHADDLYREDNPLAPVVGLDDVSLSPKLGLTRGFGEAVTAYFQYSHGFRAPPPEDVNIGLDIPLLNIRAVPNPDLQPETSNGYELGLRWNGPALTLAAAGYWTDYDDFIESKVNLGADPDSGVILFQSQNVARARIYGTELAATVRAGGLTSRLEGWTARLAAAWSRGEDLERDEPLNSVDPGSAVLSLAYEPPTGRWRGELVGTTVAAKRRVDRSRVDLYGTRSYATLDLLAQVDIGHDLWLNVGAFNLTGREYIEWADVRGRPEADPLIPYYTRPGRSATITLHWRY